MHAQQGAVAPGSLVLKDLAAPFCDLPLPAWVATSVACHMLCAGCSDASTSQQLGPQRKRGGGLPAGPGTRAGPDALEAANWIGAVRVHVLEHVFTPEVCVVHVTRAVRMHVHVRLKVSSVVMCFVKYRLAATNEAQCRTSTT
jgi:hypothetical protein